MAVHVHVRVAGDGHVVVVLWDVVPMDVTGCQSVVLDDGDHVDRHHDHTVGLRSVSSHPLYRLES